MFSQSAHLYDAIYAGSVDHAGAARRLRGLIRERRQSTGHRLLDVACGASAYLPFLREEYEVEVLDLDAGMLAIARRRLPDVRLHHADMVAFDLGRRFDVVTCLSSSIGYARTLPRMRQTIANLARHTLPGGVVAVEPWFGPEVWEPGRVTLDCVDRPELKIARLLVSGAAGAVSSLDIHDLASGPAGVETLVERHELGLFAHEEYLAAFAAAGLDPSFDAEGLVGRGLYLGLRREPAARGSEVLGDAPAGP